MPQTYRVTLSDGRKFDVTTTGGPPSEADVLAQMSAAPTPASTGPRSGIFPSFASPAIFTPEGGKALVEGGLLETLAGLGAGAGVGAMTGGAGAIPAAMAAAGGVRALRGKLSGEEAGEYVPAAMGQAAIEGIIPGGKALKTYGVKIAKPALAIGEDVAEKYGGKIGALLRQHGGIKEITRQALEAPGLGLKRTGEKLARAKNQLMDLFRGSVENLPPSIDPNDIYSAAYKEAVGTTPTQVLQTGTRPVLKQIDKELGGAMLTPKQAHDWVEGEFIRGGSDVAPAKATMRAADIETRRLVGEAVDTARRLQPGTTAGRTREASRLIDLTDVFDKTLRGQASEAPIVVPRVMISGRPGASAAKTIGGGPFRAFGMIPMPKALLYSAGKGLYRTGQALDRPYSPALWRALTQAFQERRPTPAPSHERSR